MDVLFISLQSILHLFLLLYIVRVNLLDDNLHHFWHLSLCEIDVDLELGWAESFSHVYGCESVEVFFYSFSVMC
jgi:hypothetical protein